MLRNFLYILVFIFVINCNYFPTTRNKVDKNSVQQQKKDTKVVLKEQQVEFNDELISNENTSRIIPPPISAEHSIKLSLLRKAKGDIEAFRLYAKNLRRHNESDLLVLIETAAIEYIEEHVKELSTVV